MSNSAPATLALTSPSPVRGHLSLFGRLLTLILISLLAGQVISVALIFSLPPPAPDFYRLTEVAQVLQGSAPNFSDRRALQIAMETKRPSPKMETRAAAEIARLLAQDLSISPEAIAIAGDRSPFADRRVFRIARDRLARQGFAPDEHFLVAPFAVGVRQTDGRWRVVRPAPILGLEAWQQRLILGLLISVLAMAPLAYLFARRLAQPFRRFAEAAERLGRDPRAASLPLSLSDASEINVATHAFNDMQERLRRYVEDRTAMVGAIAHDLRTPLTRLKFRIEGAPDDLRVKMAADIDQMEEMIAAALTFVRDSSEPGPRVRLELSSLVESICDEMAQTGAAADVMRADKLVLEGDPLALRRLLANLVDNAIKYGDRARARVYLQDRIAIVEISDDGPGIPEAEIERVFEPFYRREPSRNRNTGGMGLGLAVVRSVARGHGGDVTLANRVGGGLTATVRLPI